MAASSLFCALCSSPSHSEGEVKALKAAKAKKAATAKKETTSSKLKASIGRKIVGTNNRVFFVGATDLVAKLGGDPAEYCRQHGKSLVSEGAAEKGLVDVLIFETQFVAARLQEDTPGKVLFWQWIARCYGKLTADYDWFDNPRSVAYKFMPATSYKKAIYRTNTFCTKWPFISQQIADMAAASKSKWKLIADPKQIKASSIYAILLIGCGQIDCPCFKGWVR